MSLSVFGPKVSGVHIGPINLGIFVQIFHVPGDPPGCFTLTATSPLGSKTQLIVANGAKTTLEIVANELTATIATDDWNPHLSTAQAMCSFKVTLRAQGHVRIPPLPIAIPIDVQVDAYDVVLHRTLADHAAFVDAMSNAMSTSGR